MYPLVKMQQTIFDYIEGCTNNVMILGKPGVGKSVLINALVENGQKDYDVAAPTGLAAINVGGKTLHSLFKIPVFENGSIPHNMPLPDRKEFIHLSRVRHLIIDEISMCRADMLDHINRVLQYFHNNQKPFGGIQVILVGDFCQLAPVCKADVRAEMKADGYLSEFAFDAKCFYREDFKIFVLEEVLRQKDDLYFMEILNAARFGTLTAPMLDDLNDLVGLPQPESIMLCATNAQADTVNSNQLRRCPIPGTLYEAAVAGDYPQNLRPLPDVIEMREGAQVMVKLNKADRDPDSEERVQPTVLVNGTLGRVIECSRETARIEVYDGPSATVYRQTFERTRKVQEDNGEGGKTWRKQVIASFNQLPLAPAWAISMHKSQGQSFDKVNIDPSKTFAPGQLYVALSRARTMQGMTLISPVELRMFKVNTHVKMFYESL